MDQRQLIRKLLERIDPADLGDGFSLKASRASLERPIACGHQAYWLYHRISKGPRGEKVLVVEPGLGIEFPMISRFLRFIREPERVNEVSRRHYLINANLGLLKEDRKGFEYFELRGEADIEPVRSALHADIVGIVAPIFVHFRCMEDFVSPPYGSPKLQALMREDLLSRVAFAYCLRGVEAAIATVAEQPSYFYGTSGQAGVAGTHLVISRIRSYSPAKP